MTDKNQSCGTESEKSNIKFPCGNFEKLLKAFRECRNEKTGEFDCSTIMKKFNEDGDEKTGCMTMIQNLCSGKEGPIDCKALMSKLVANMKAKTKQSE
jgi:hypothetical protein